MTMKKILKTKKGKVLCISLAVLLLSVGALLYILFGMGNGEKSAEEDPAVIETADSITYVKGGLYDTVSEYGTGTVCADGVDIRNATYDMLEIAEEVGDGSVALQNVRVKTALAVNGGGVHSLTLTSSRITVLIVNDEDCHLVIGEGCVVEELVARPSNRIDVYGKVSVLELLSSETDTVSEEAGLNLYKSAEIGRLSTSGLVTVNDYGAYVMERSVMSSEEMDAVRQAALNLTGVSMQNKIAVESEKTAETDEAPAEEIPSEPEEGITTIEDAEEAAEEETASTGTSKWNTTKPELPWLNPGAADDYELPIPSSEVPTGVKPGEEAAASQTTTSEQPSIDVSETEIVMNGVTAIGDSVMLGAKENLESKFSNIYVDARESRQVWDGKALVQSAEAQGKLYSSVVIALGTNSTFSTSVGQGIIDAVGNRQVYWVNTFGEEWQDQVNATIQQLCNNNSNVTLIDWAAEAAGHSDWFYTDGIHLTPAGREGYANLVARIVKN